jgi:S-adenosylmethionine/arginine decarboxylase-like enzyme
MAYWGYHLMLDCSGCDVNLIDSKDNIDAFVKRLVSRINMKAYGDPTIVRFAEHDADKAGYSLVQLIETSSITGHFVPAHGHAYIDIFSCKEFSIEVCEASVMEYFGAENVKISYLTRQA